MQKNIIISVVGSLVLGVILGFLLASFRPMGMFGFGTGFNRHMMPNGEMMHGREMDMEGMMDSMNSALTGKTGDEFDQAFLAEMIVHHEGAVVMAKSALTNAGHQEIKDLAEAIISAQNKEIADMKSWQKTWYNK